MTRSKITVDPKWSFDEALINSTEAYPPSGYKNPVARLVLMEAWGAAVGATRASAELEQAIAEAGSVAAAARDFRMAATTVKQLRAYYKALPDPGRSHFADGVLVAGRFRILETIAVGGMGMVYRADDVTLKQRVALKHCASDAPEVDHERFKREVETMAGIDHPNVMKVIHFDLNAVPAFFVMPEANKRLDEVVRELRTSKDELLRVFGEVCSGLQAIHDAGHVHRDIKPHNILRVNDRWVVSDLGLVSAATQSNLTRTQEFLGTPGYVAPELLFGKRTPNVRSDIFSLGQVLYEVLAEEAPGFVDTDLLPEWCRAVVGKATQQTPSSRFGSVREMMDALTLAAR